MSHNLNILLSFFFACLDIFFGRRRSIYTLTFDHKLCVHIYPMGRRGECRRIEKFNIFGDIHKKIFRHMQERRVEMRIEEQKLKWSKVMKNERITRKKHFNVKCLVDLLSSPSPLDLAPLWELSVSLRDLVHHPRQIYIASFARAANGDDSWIKVRIIINSWTLKMRIKHIN